MYTPKMIRRANKRQRRWTTVDNAFVVVLLVLFSLITFEIVTGSPTVTLHLVSPPLRSPAQGDVVGSEQ